MLGLLVRPERRCGAGVVASGALVTAGETAYAVWAVPPASALVTPDDLGTAAETAYAAWSVPAASATVAALPGGGTAVPFVWESVVGATYYVLAVGTTEGGPYTTYNGSVGNVLTTTLSLASGTYYSIVLAYDDSGWLSTRPEQEVTV